MKPILQLALDFVDLKRALKSAEAGVAGGVASQMVMGPDRKMTAAFTCLVGGMPATKMTSMTGQNGMSLNVPGASLVPSQFKVAILK